MNDQRRQILTFLVLTFSLSSIFYFLIIKSGHLGGGGGSYVLGIMWCPGTAALLTMKLHGRSLGDLGWKWGEARYQVWSYLIPLLYGTVAYGAVWATGLGRFYDHEFVAAMSARFGLGELPQWAGATLYFLFVATTGMVRSCSSALGEEIGWRGFFVPQLAKVTGSFCTPISWMI